MPRAGLNTDVVVTEAARLVDEVGLDGVTLSALAARFGVAVPSLYKHVDGLDDLRRRLAVRAVTELGAALSAATSGPGDAAPIARMAAAYRGYAHAHPGRYATTVRAPAEDDADHLRASQEVLEGVLAVLADYGITGDDAIDATRTVRSALHGFISLEAAGGFGLPQDVERSYARLVTSLHTVLTAWPAIATPAPASAPPPADAPRPLASPS